MFTTLIVQPIFNILVLIYAILPGHNFGLAIIVFTILLRLVMWPLVKKQLHHTKVIRKLQPELKKIKKAAKGDRQKESTLMMELYRERGINPFAPLGPLLIQLPIFIGLYSGLRRIVDDPEQLTSFAYPFLQNMDWMQGVAANIDKFDETLFGFVDLTRSAIGPEGLYIPALVIVIASVIVQFFQAKQIMPQDTDARNLRQILKEAGSGKQADQSEVNAAVGKSMLYLLPALVFMFTVSIASALSLYWLVAGVVAFIQQSIVLNKDIEELEEVASKKSKKKSTTKITIKNSGAESEANEESGKTDSKESNETIKAVPSSAKSSQKNNQKNKKKTSNKSGKRKKRRK